MIVDDITNFKKYLGLNKYFKKAFDFLIDFDVNSFDNGKLIIESDNLYAIVSKIGDSNLSEIKMESHQKYIDIHFVIKGNETLGWKSLNYCDEKIGDFNIEKDYILYQEKEFMKFTITKNKFVVFFPEDVHVPSIHTSDLIKIVMKVKIE